MAQRIQYKWECGEDTKYIMLIDPEEIDSLIEDQIKLIMPWWIIKCKDYSRSTMFVSKDYWFQVLKGSCQRLLWRIWSYAEKQEPCSRLVTYESDQASGVRTLIASSCQWYDFKYSILVED